MPDAQRLMWDPAAARGPAFELAWLEGANTVPVKERLPRLASDSAFLDALDPAQRARFLAVWQRKGDPLALKSFQETHGPAWVGGSPAVQHD